MLTSASNQYLRPEYLTPLPTTLDAKKSPLALLAQTCSQIGADTPNSKLLASAEKTSKPSSKGTGDAGREKGSSGGGPDSAKKPFDAPHPREKSRSPEERAGAASAGGRARTPAPPRGGRCGSNHSAASPGASPAAPERKSPPGIGASPPARPADGGGSSPAPAPRTAFTPNILTSSSDPAIKDLPLGTFKPGAPAAPPFLGAYPGFPLPMDLVAGGALMAQHHLKAATLGPYLGYGRAKAADALSPACRDPYCTGCGVGAHLLGSPKAPAAACPAGCAQCDHAKTPTSSAYLGHGPAAAAAAAAYAHAQLAALAAASHLPYVCNWISGDAAYCGKRFSSSEELLAHLRTHTSVAVSEAGSALSLLGAAAALPPTHPLLHRTYPTPPLSPLAAPRYHPYSKPSSLLPPTLTSALPAFPLSHPGLPPYLSPYSLYGPRLGAAPGMHP